MVPILLVALTLGAAQSPAPFVIAGQQVTASQRLDFDLAVPAGVDAATRIPSPCSTARGLGRCWP